MSMKPKPSTSRHTPVASVDEAIRSRKSVRAFLPTPIPRQTIAELLDVASRAPSGTNTQPWKVRVIVGEPKAELSRRILEVHGDPKQRAEHRREYDYYPTQWVSPYIERRRKVGWDMYGLLGIAKGEHERTLAQHGRNFAFFDAPVGLMFTIDPILERGSWLDFGMFLQNVMLAARARGLDTCPQAAFCEFHQIVADVLQIPDNEMLVCGMSLGYADPDAIVNTLVTAREPVEGFVKFIGFGD